MTTQQIVDMASEMGHSAWRATEQALAEAQKYEESKNEDDKYYADIAADRAKEIREAWRAFMKKEWQ